MLEWELSRCSWKSSGGWKPTEDTVLFWTDLAGAPLSKKVSLVRNNEQRGSAPAEAGDEWVAIRPMASKRFLSDRKTLSSHSQFYFVPFHLIFHIMGAVKEIL